MIRVMAATAMTFVASQASAETYHCAARVVLGFDGVIIHDWRGTGDNQGQVVFSFDSAMGEYLEQTVGSAAAATDSAKLEVVLNKASGAGSILAVSVPRALALKVDESVHGVNYARFGREGHAEIGKCEKVR